MTRNMSHNLGSHYLHYTKTQLEQLAKKGGEFGPDIRGAARVMGYMQGRMEYLATLVSGDRYPYGCVNFKSQIFDELTIDDFSKRHFEIEQGKNVSAIYDRIADIVDEIYENGCNEKIIKQYLPEIYCQRGYSCLLHRRSIYGCDRISLPLWSDRQGIGPADYGGHLFHHGRAGHLRCWYQSLFSQSGPGYYCQACT